MTKSNVSKLKRLVNRKSGLSQYVVSKSFNCHPTYIGKTLKRKTNIKLRKKRNYLIEHRNSRLKLDQVCNYIAEIQEFYPESWTIKLILLYLTQLSMETILLNTDSIKRALPEVRYRIKAKYEENRVKCTKIIGRIIFEIT